MISQLQRLEKIVEGLGTNHTIAVTIEKNRINIFIGKNIK